MKQTLENLAKAFVGESQARNRYTFYTKIAKKEGYVQIGNIFEETAGQEKEHAKRLFKLIQQLKKKMSVSIKSLKFETEAPLTLASTAENLKAAIVGEHYENTIMYPEFADAAENEGLDDIAAVLRSIGRAEVHHEERYTELLKQVENDTVFKKEQKVYWVCSNCGYIHEGEEPPDKCPACNHAKNYFQVKCETY